LEYYEKALPIRREVGDRGGEATTLNNIGRVYDAQGRQQEALEYFEKALLIFREVGDRWGESILLANIGRVLDALGRTAEAVRYFELSVALDEELGHPNLESHRAKLAEVKSKLDQET
jgi:tetratricopeptide (TPR) repeat protein